MNNLHQDGDLIAGRYEVVGPPMQGGMGLVYICRDLTDDRPVALKTFKGEYLKNRAARDRFLREGTAWVELGYHPHIVRCYRVEYVDPVVYLVLELIAKEPGREGASLREWLTPGRGLGVEPALLYALQIARGMKHASEKIAGFVHRDLKPENVLVGADKLPGTPCQRLRVTDFGLVRALADAGKETPEKDDPAALGRTHLTHGVMGTPLYMAPEQWRGEEVSAATDVYALGCILYEMLSGERAVKGKTIAELRAGHCAEKPGLKLEGYPVEVRRLLERCLALEPGQRFGDWASLESELGQVYAHVTGSQPPEEERPGAGSREERVAEGWSFNAIGMSYKDLGKARVAIGYHQHAAQVGRVERERMLEGAALVNLGNACYRLGEVQHAIEYYEQALVILREIGDRHGESNVLGDLGIVYVALKKVQRAIGYHEQALVILREIGDRRGEGAVLVNLGYAYFRLGEVQRAIEYFEQGMMINREVGDRRGEGTALGNLGIVYSALEKVQRAIGYYEQSLAIRKEIGDINGVALDSFNMATLYNQQGETVKALPLAQTAAEIWQRMGHAEYARRAQELVEQLRKLR